jgi:hypothetical protein
MEGNAHFILCPSNIVPAGKPSGDHLFLVDQEGTHYVDCPEVQLTYKPDLVLMSGSGPRRSTPHRPRGRGVNPQTNTVVVRSDRDRHL